jgi:hypothetical protein
MGQVRARGVDDSDASSAIGPAWRIGSSVSGTKHCMHCVLCTCARRSHARWRSPIVLRTLQSSAVRQAHFARSFAYTAATRSRPCCLRRATGPLGGRRPGTCRHIHARLHGIRAPRICDGHRSGADASGGADGPGAEVGAHPTSRSVFECDFGPCAPLCGVAGPSPSSSAPRPSPMSRTVAYANRHQADKAHGAGRGIHPSKGAGGRGAPAGLARSPRRAP